ncbi:methyltransferase domain-containing protein [Myxococcota bacterium]|nr:methyltransferase domain-containing protein [Myxococcota bacterium]
MKPVAYELMEQWSRDHWWYRARREILVDVFERFVDKGSLVLDFGAGNGETGRALARNDYRVLAADPEESALKLCHAKGLETLNLGRERPASETFDAILAADVLEHVEDDLELLRELCGCLRPSGRLVLTVPAYEFLWSGEDYVSGHLRRYTRTRLQRRVAESGARVLWSSYFNTWLLPGITLAILAARLFQPRRMYVSNVAPAPDFANAWLYRLFRSEARWLRRSTLPMGASILLVAER